MSDPWFLFQVSSTFGIRRVDCSGRGLPDGFKRRAEFSGRDKDGSLAFLLWMWVGTGQASVSDAILDRPDDARSVPADVHVCMHSQFAVMNLSTRGDADDGLAQVHGDLQFLFNPIAVGGGQAGEEDEAVAVPDSFVQFHPKLTIGVGVSDRVILGDGIILESNLCLRQYFYQFVVFIGISPGMAYESVDDLQWMSFACGRSD